MLCQVLHPMCRLYHHLLQQKEQQEQKYIHHKFLFINLMLQIVLIINIIDVINHQIANNNVFYGRVTTKETFFFLFPLDIRYAICYSNESDLCVYWSSVNFKVVGFMVVMWPWPYGFTWPKASKEINYLLNVFVSISFCTMCRTLKMLFTSIDKLRVSYDKLFFFLLCLCGNFVLSL